MADWLKRMWRRQPTIGDHIAASLNNDRHEWRIVRSGPFTWEHINDKRNWRVLLYSDCFSQSASFDGCYLKGREQRRILRALNRFHGDHRAERRSVAERRASIRSVG